MIEVGILKNFDSGTYKAGVQLAGSLTTYFDDISVAKNIPSSALVIGNYVILAIPGGNPKDACVIASWPGGSPGGGAGTFLELTDTPSSYSGQAGKVAKVKATEDGLEFGEGGGAASGENWLVPLTNKSGASTQEGYVYRLDPDNDNSFDYASEEEDAQVVVSQGVIANNAAGDMVIGGYEDVYVNGTTVRGQFLYFSSTNGQAKPSWRRRDGAFAQAMASRTGAGLVKAYIFPREKIRKQALADEPGWEKMYLLPYSGGGTDKWIDDGVVLTIGAGGTWDDVHCAHPSVVYLPGGTMLMAYAGYDGSRWRIGVATSTDKGLTWTKYAGNPVIDRNTAGKNVYMPTIIYDRWASGVGTHAYYKMWFTDGTDNLLAYAYSNDGFTWTDHGNLTNPTNYNKGNCVLRFGGLYFLLYGNAANDTMYIATSEDGLTWTYRATLLTVGAAGAWDDNQVGYASIYWNQGVWYIIYSGNPGTPNSYSIGMAYNWDPFTTFTKWIDNPIIDVKPGTYRSNNIVYGQLIHIDNQFYIFGSADDGTNAKIARFRLLANPGS